MLVAGQRVLGVVELPFVDVPEVQPGAGAIGCVEIVHGRGQLGGELGPIVRDRGQTLQVAPGGARRHFAVGRQERGERARRIVVLMLERRGQLAQPLPAPLRIGLGIDARQLLLELRRQVAQRRLFRHVAQQGRQLLLDLRGEVGRTPAAVRLLRGNHLEWHGAFG